MKKLTAIVLPLALLGALVVAACGKTPGTASSNTPSGPVTTIYENSALFVDASGNPIHAATVKVNTPITFSDTINRGGTHFICVGSSGSTGGSNACLSSGNGPKEFYGGSGFSGMMMSGPNTYPITFPNTGTYHVICTVHAGMYVDVTVVS